MDSLLTLYPKLTNRAILAERIETESEEVRRYYYSLTLGSYQDAIDRFPPLPVKAEFTSQPSGVQEQFRDAKAWVTDQATQRKVVLQAIYNNVNGVAAKLELAPAADHDVQVADVADCKTITDKATAEIAKVDAVLTAQAEQMEP